MSNRLRRYAGDAACCRLCLRVNPGLLLHRAQTSQGGCAKCSSNPWYDTLCNAVVCLDICARLLSTGCTDALSTDCDSFNCRARLVTNAVHVARGAPDLALRSARSLCRPWHGVRTSIAQLERLADVQDRSAERRSTAVGVPTTCASAAYSAVQDRGACMLQPAASRTTHRCAESASLSSSRSARLALCARA